MSLSSHDHFQKLTVDIDSEARVLGILIKHPDRIQEVANLIISAYFTDSFHKKVYEALKVVYNQTGRVSYTQLYNRLRRDETIESASESLLGLTQTFAGASELLPSIDNLRYKYGIRRLLEAADYIRDMTLKDDDEDLSRLRAQAQEIIFSATQNDDGRTAEVKSLFDVLTKCYSKLLERRQGNEDSYGLSVRFPSVDAMTTGLKKKDLIILAARPSMGKTAFALNMVMNVAQRQIPVLVFSLEMDDEQIGDRLVLSQFFEGRGEGRVDITSDEYQTRLTDEQFSQAQDVFSKLYELPVKIIDKRGLTCDEIRAFARKVKADTPDLGLIVIDYLQLIKTQLTHNKSWTLAVGEVVRELRDLAGELDVPLILISQLNRSVESRENKRPLMSDLRDSGNIEEFADIVVFLYRDDYYNPEQAEQEGTEGLVEVIFAKQRKGKTGTVRLRFISDYTRFIEEYSAGD